MKLLKRPLVIPKFVCVKCGSLNVRHVKGDFYKCQDCFHTFKLCWGLGFNKKIFSQYEMIKDYDNFMRTKYFKLFLSLNKSDIFLDAGCGFGFFTLYAGTIVKQAIGIDIDESRLREARKTKKKMNIKNVDFKVANIYNIPYPKDYFDKVLCAEVLEHLLKPDNALRELTRVCRKTLVIQIPTVNFFKNVGEKIFGSVVKEPKSVKESQFESLPHVQRFITKSILKLIKSYRLKVISLVGVRLIPINQLTDNRFLVNSEYLCDVLLGVRFPFNMMGTMTIIKCQKT